MAVSDYYRCIKEAARLGWKLDSNWTDPTLFAIYYMIRPLSGLLIVRFMFIIVSAGGSFNPSYFAYLFIGTTFFLYMAQLAQTMSMLIPEEKARYESMKQVYISPGSIRPYIIGRAFAAMFNATISVIITFVLGDLIFSIVFRQPLDIDLMRVNYPALALSLVLGVVGLTAVGYILSAVSLVSNRLQWNLSEYVTGIFLLLGGVWFPPSVLPPVASQVSMILPVTWFLASVRASMIQQFVSSLPTDLVYLAVSSVVSMVVAYSIFAYCENFARKRGILDRKAEA